MSVLLFECDTLATEGGCPLRILGTVLQVPAEVLKKSFETQHKLDDAVRPLVVKTAEQFWTEMSIILLALEDVRRSISRDGSFSIDADEAKALVATLQPAHNSLDNARELVYGPVNSYVGLPAALVALLSLQWTSVAIDKAKSCIKAAEMAPSADPDAPDLAQLRQENEDLFEYYLSHVRQAQIEFGQEIRAALRTWSVRPIEAWKWRRAVRRRERQYETLQDQMMALANEMRNASRQRAAQTDSHEQWLKRQEAENALVQAFLIDSQNNIDDIGRRLDDASGRRSASS